jgi:hypothetical protein
MPGQRFVDFDAQRRREFGVLRHPSSALPEFGIFKPAEVGYI